MDADVSQRLQAIEARLAAIEQFIGLNHAPVGGPMGGTPMPDGSIAPPPDLATQQAMASGNMIGAIKAYREQTGASLVQAKMAIEIMMGRH
ncbi:MAG TPA: hypothetical protein VGM78_08390 [Ilumatobacteraceae bacterium]|jgi:ribosomal protein L7/L12